MGFLKKIKSFFHKEAEPVKEERKPVAAVAEKREVKQPEKATAPKVSAVKAVEEKKSLVVKAEKKTIPNVLLRPVITEKATLTGTYLFEVLPSSTKNEVYKAIERLYGVIPESVRICNSKGKEVRWNYRWGKQKDIKRAIVKLPKGQTIDVYEGT